MWLAGAGGFQANILILLTNIPNPRIWRQAKSYGSDASVGFRLATGSAAVDRCSPVLPVSWPLATNRRPTYLSMTAPRSRRALARPSAQPLRQDRLGDAPAKHNRGCSCNERGPEMTDQDRFGFLMPRRGCLGSNSASGERLVPFSLREPSPNFAESASVTGIFRCVHSPHLVPDCRRPCANCHGPGGHSPGAISSIASLPPEEATADPFVRNKPGLLEVIKDRKATLRSSAA